MRSGILRNRRKNQPILSAGFCHTGIRPSGPAHLVVDSTGLKGFGEGDWLASKHKIKIKRKRWRKLHLGLDLISGELICSELTMDDVGDPTALPVLVDQIDGQSPSLSLFGYFNLCNWGGTLDRRVTATSVPCHTLNVHIRCA